MTPICLVTGFLGTGKTTLLKNIVARHRGRRLVYLVNEFSAMDVDGALLLGEGADTVSIPGGSIFCKCLVSQFIDRLGEIPAKHPGVEGVVIEASGVADPAVVRKMLAETGLDKLYQLRSVLSVADPKSLYKLLKTLPNIRSQIAASDRALVNKCDLCSEEEIRRAEDQIREINPAVALFRTVRCEVDFDIFSPGAPTGGVDGEYGLCRDPNFAKISVELGETGFEDFQRLLAPALQDVFRVKGFALVGGEPSLVDYSEAGWDVRPGAGGELGRLAMIVSGAAEVRLRERLGKLAEG